MTIDHRSRTIQRIQLLIRIPLVVLAFVLLPVAPIFAQSQPPEITLSPSSAPVGTLVLVSGIGFPADATGDISLDNDTVLGSFITDAGGNFAFELTVPDIGPGTYTVSATVETGDATTDALLTVETVSDESTAPGVDEGEIIADSTSTLEAIEAAPEPAETPYYPIAGSSQSENSPDADITYDGDPNTYWITDSITPEVAFVTLDLGEVLPIGFAHWLLATNGTLSTVEILLSEDGENWVSLDLLDGSSMPVGEWIEHPFDVSARFVRFTLANPNGLPQIGGFAEIQLWPAANARSLAELAESEEPEVPTPTEQEQEQEQPTATTAPLPDVTGQGTITGTGGDGANCRIAPDPEAAPITVFMDDTVVDLTGPPVGDWQPVICEGQAGFVSTQFVKAEKTEGLAPEVATTPTEEATATSVEPTTQPDEVATPNIEVTPQPEEGRASSQVIGQGIVTGTGGDAVNCRVAPSIEADLITAVPENSMVDLTGPPEGDWQPVICDGQPGFISAQYIQPVADEGPSVEPTANDAASPALSTETAVSTATSAASPVTATATPTISPTSEVASPAVIDDSTPLPDTATPAETMPVTVPPVSAAGPLTFSAIADASVLQDQPTTNFGNQPVLIADLDPMRESYLLFNVTGVDGSVERATLRLWVTNGTDDGPELFTSSDTSWSETGITWESKPALGESLGNQEGTPSRNWVEYDVTSVVTGDGTYGFGLIADSSDGLYVNSREAANAPPELVLTTSGDPTPPQATPTQPVATPAATPIDATPDPGTGPIPGPSLSLPLRGAFYYPWYPTAWNQKGLSPYTEYTPSLGFYDSDDPAVIANHIDAMQYGNIQVGIASWWGPGTREDAVLPQLLSAAAGTGFTWTVYYEDEGFGDPSVETLRSDLEYLRENYAADPSYLRINGKFVVFVYGGSESCEMADRWAEANTVDAYIVLKVFSGYRDCASQPDGWHQYGPVSPFDQQGTHSYTISPGFVLAGGPIRLARDIERWEQNVQSMVNSGADWQLVSSFNEWGEGTAIESAEEWQSASGYGQYLDVLHANGQGAPPPITPTVIPTQEPVTPTVTPTQVAPTPTPPPPTGETAVLLAAGDIATCNGSGDDQTADILDGQSGTVATLGDNVYQSGTAKEFAECYDPTWGRHKARTKPSAGNHDYRTEGAAAYYDYFGSAAGDPAMGYYSYDLGAWHIIVLNSNIDMGPASAQVQWLTNDLNANASACTLAYWHHPRFSSSSVHGNNPNTGTLFGTLYAHGAEIVLNGHDHTYERFGLQDPDANADPDFGIREFVVGTGGGSLYGLSSPEPNSEVRHNTTFGIIKLTLRPDGYSWQFLPVAGKTFTDSGSGACHSAPGSAMVTGSDSLMSVPLLPINPMTIIAPAMAVRTPERRKKASYRRMVRLTVRLPMRQEGETS